MNIQDLMKLGYATGMGKANEVFQEILEKDKEIEDCPECGGSKNNHSNDCVGVE